ncbi:hypothetical protein P168DRAFT_6433 [Aspergillus campestris IBT 28561]|uniref:Uncharacterized protein n=1 Tax=Aspergillus campestris (strain IBT 28561) TaxID=1392248 RepID=A0A2I1DDQ2_ASPC2|nr:uncharacterized protein P168DRAFT_6433 [Aspergillus campestris IBT 28561]PKY08019.1 hypothetical protein P168DRAFT_6433 [Aspergillus campestris IBT 28561]
MDSSNHDLSLWIILKIMFLSRLLSHRLTHLTLPRHAPCILSHNASWPLATGHSPCQSSRPSSDCFDYEWLHSHPPLVRLVLWICLAASAVTNPAPVPTKPDWIMGRSHGSLP